MHNYKELLIDILNNGIDKPDRTGVGVRSVWGRMLRWNLSEGFPMITTRKVSFRIAFEETMFFLRGERDTKQLEDKNIHIWSGNTSREFLDNRGLSHLPEGDMGYGYSHQWRNFGGIDEPLTSGIDQVQQLINGLVSDPYSRRHIVSAWNPQQLSGTPLPPCHIMHQYQVTPDNKLNSAFYMRSNDVYLGLPTNIMGYAFLNLALSKLCGFEPGELVYMGADVHLYHNQLEVAQMQTQREPKSLPQLVFHKDFTTFEELLSVEWKDVEIVGYDPHPSLPKVPMAV